MGTRDANCFAAFTAVSAAGEALRLARESGQARWAVAAQLAQATIAAERGDGDFAEALTGEVEALLLPMGANPMLALVQFVRGRGAVVNQHYAIGLEHLRRTFDPANPAFHPFAGAWALADLVEAAVQTGGQELGGYLEQLEAVIRKSPGGPLRAQAAYARPLIADDDQVEALCLAALERDLVEKPSYRGRMLLWYGRRLRRVAESRAPLRAAVEIFQALGFHELAEHARRELRASGETSRRERSAALDQLTPQELQIAQLTAEGFSNRAIGEQLLISHRTVGCHLHTIFEKLGITSRSQLHAALPGLR